MGAGTVGGMDRCGLCGDKARLDRFGVCAVRHNCEARVARHEARMARLNRAMDAADPGTPTCPHCDDRDCPGAFAPPPPPWDFLT